MSFVTLKPTLKKNLHPKQHLNLYLYLYLCLLFSLCLSLVLCWWVVEFVDVGPGVSLFWKVFTTGRERFKRQSHAFVGGSDAIKFKTLLRREQRHSTDVQLVTKSVRISCVFAQFSRAPWGSGLDDDANVRRAREIQRSGIPRSVRPSLVGRVV